MTLKAADWIAVLNDGEDLNDRLDELTKERDKEPRLASRSRLKYDLTHRIPDAELRFTVIEDTSPYLDGIYDLRKVHHTNPVMYQTEINGVTHWTDRPSVQALYDYTNPELSRLHYLSARPLISKEQTSYEAWRQRYLERWKKDWYNNLVRRLKYLTKVQVRVTKIQKVIDELEAKIRKYRDRPGGRPNWFPAAFARWMEKLNRYANYLLIAKSDYDKLLLDPLGGTLAPWGHMSSWERYSCKDWDLINRQRVREKRSALREFQKKAKVTLLPCCHVSYVRNACPIFHMSAHYHFVDNGHFDGTNFVPIKWDSQVGADLPLGDFDTTKGFYRLAPANLDADWDFNVDHNKLFDALASVKLQHDDDFAGLLVDIKEFPGLVDGIKNLGKQIATLHDLLWGSEIAKNQSVLKLTEYLLTGNAPWDRANGSLGSGRRIIGGNPLTGGGVTIIPEVQRQSILQPYKAGRAPITVGGIRDVMKFLSLMDLNRMYGISDSARASLRMIKQYIDQWSVYGKRMSRLIDRNGKQKVYHRRVDTGSSESRAEVPIEDALHDILAAHHEYGTYFVQQPGGTNGLPRALQEAQKAGCKIVRVTTTTYVQYLTVVGTLTLETPWGTSLTDNAVELSYFMDLFGLNFNPKALWDATHWTFVVDYLVDIGKWLDDNFHGHWLNGRLHIHSACITHLEKQVTRYTVAGGRKHTTATSPDGAATASFDLNADITDGLITRRRFVRKLVDPDWLLSLRKDPDWTRYVPLAKISAENDWLNPSLWSRFQSIADLIIAGAASHKYNLKAITRSM